MEQGTRKKYEIMLKIGYVCIIFFPLVSVILSYIMRSDVSEDAILPSHCTWQIRTFWWSLGLGIVGYILTVTMVGAVVGLPLILAVWVWCIYRAIKGFFALEKNAALV